MGLVRFACTLILLLAPAPVDDSGASSALRSCNPAVVHEDRAVELAVQSIATQGEVCSTAGRQYPPRRLPRRSVSPLLPGTLYAHVGTLLVPCSAETVAFSYPYLGSSLYIFMALLR